MIEIRKMIKLAKAEQRRDNKENKLSFDDWMEKNSGELQDKYVEMCKEEYEKYKR